MNFSPKGPMMLKISGLKPSGWGQNLGRNAHPIFLSVKFSKIPFFGLPYFSVFLGYANFHQFWAADKIQAIV